MPIRAIVFDLYGTLYELQAVARACENAFPTRGVALAQRWRQKQLEYSWLRSLMARYVPFDQVTEEALVFACTEQGLELDPATLRSLCQAWLHLPPYADMAANVRRLKDAGLALAILSNGARAMLDQVLVNSSMQWGFEHVISVDEVRLFKPHPQVYQLAEQRLAMPREQLLFVSGNAWDAGAARLFGLPVCWINRQQQPFDQLGAAPTVELPDLKQMVDWVLAEI
ncbi:MAG: haloacid dehalogenase type II [Pseudomonadota bacterium]